MPRRDGTGPMGEGALTGRGAGICNDGDINRRVGRYRRNGYGRGYRAGGSMLGAGFGRGFRFCRNIITNTMSDKEYYEGEKKLVEKYLERINDRLDNLKN